MRECNEIKKKDEKRIGHFLTDNAKFPSTLKGV